MPATFIQEAHGPGAFVNQGQVALLNPTPAGRLIVVTIWGWEQNTYTVADTAGNTYTIAENSTSFESCAIAYAIASTTATLTVIAAAGAGGGAPGQVYIQVREYDFPGAKLDQVFSRIGKYTGTAPNQWGEGTNLFNLEDTLVIASAQFSDSSTLVNNPSPSGDIPVFAFGETIPGGNVTNITYEKMDTGPGTRGMNVTGHGTNPNARGVIVGYTFSVPLTRPGGTTKQFAARSGLSAILGVYSGQSQVTLTLPYVPLPGSLMVVGAGCGQNFGAGKTFTITDSIGSTYTQREADIGGAPTPRAVQSTIFTAILGAVPAGALFHITMTMSGGSGNFDDSSLIAAEYVLIPGVISGAVYASDSAGLVKTSAVSTSAGTLIVGFAEAFEIAATQPTVWTGAAGFTVESSLGIPVPDGAVAQVQQVRMGRAALVDKNTISLGSYDAEVQSSLTSTVFSMVMITIHITVPGGSYIRTRRGAFILI